MSTDLNSYDSSMSSETTHASDEEESTSGEEDSPLPRLVPVQGPGDETRRHPVHKSGGRGRPVCRSSCPSSSAFILLVKARRQRRAQSQSRPAGGVCRHRSRVTLSRRQQSPGWPSEFVGRTASRSSYQGQLLNRHRLPELVCRMSVAPCLECSNPIRRGACVPVVRDAARCHSEPRGVSRGKATPSPVQKTGDGTLLTDGVARWAPDDCITCGAELVLRATILGPRAGRPWLMTPLHGMTRVTAWPYLYPARGQHGSLVPGLQCCILMLLCYC